LSVFPPPPFFLNTFLKFEEINTTPFLIEIKNIYEEIEDEFSKEDITRV